MIHGRNIRNHKTIENKTAVVDTRLMLATKKQKQIVASPYAQRKTKETQNDAGSTDLSIPINATIINTGKYPRRPRFIHELRHSLLLNPMSFIEIVTGEQKNTNPC